MAHLTPTTAPDIIGEHGKAWRCDLEAFRKKYHNPEDATVCVWIVYAPWAHPVWNSYAVVLVHLREMEGAKPPTLAFPGATHETLILAVDPKLQLDVAVAVPYLMPPNFVGQLKVDSDDAAAARVEAEVREICAGRLNPDTDAIRQWVAIYGDAALKPEYRLSARGSQPMGHA